MNKKSWESRLDKDTNVLSNDCISRQAALDIYDDYNIAVENGDLGAYRRYRKQLLELPSAQPGEIPWNSGRFPEESGTYTVTAYDGATKRVTYAKYQKRLKRWELTGARAYWRVLAWMPLPDPWEGDKNE